MTAQVVLGALTIGIDQLVGDKTMFCNAERGVLIGETPVTLPPHRTVIEVLETVAVDDETVEGCRQLVEAGFRIALDDFVWIPGAERLLELASIVKIDVLALSRAEVAALVDRCRPYGVELLAEKVESPDDVAWAMGSASTCSRATRSSGPRSCAAAPSARRLPPTPSWPSPCSTRTSTSTSSRRSCGASPGWSSRCCRWPRSAATSDCAARCTPCGRRWCCWAPPGSGSGSR